MDTPIMFEVLVLLTGKNYSQMFLLKKIDVCGILLENVLNTYMQYHQFTNLKLI